MESVGNAGDVGEVGVEDPQVLAGLHHVGGSIAQQDQGSVAVELRVELPEGVVDAPARCTGIRITNQSGFIV